MSKPYYTLHEQNVNRLTEAIQILNRIEVDTFFYDSDLANQITPTRVVLKKILSEVKQAHADKL
jgi:hypothetical protein